MKRSRVAGLALCGALLVAAVGAWLGLESNTPGAGEPLARERASFGKPATSPGSQAVNDLTEGRSSRSDRVVVPDGGTTHVVFCAEAMEADIVFQSAKIRLEAIDQAQRIPFRVSSARSECDLPPGQYNVDWGDEAWMRGSTRISVHPAMAKAIRLDLVPRYALTVCLVDKDAGIPLAGGSIKASFERLDANGGTYVVAKEPMDVSARFTMCGLPTHTGRVKFEVKADGYVPLVTPWLSLVEGAPGESRTFELSSVEASSTVVLGSVVDGVGGPIPDASVCAIDAAVSPEALVRRGNRFDAERFARSPAIDRVLHAEARTDHEGRFRMTVIGERPIRIGVQASGFAVGFSGPVHVRKGRIVSLEPITLGPDGRLEVVVTQSGTGVGPPLVLDGVQLCGGSLQVYERLDEQGECKVAGLPAGDYELRVRGHGPVGGTLVVVTDGLRVSPGENHHEVVIGAAGGFTVRGELVLPQNLDSEQCSVGAFSMDAGLKLISGGIVDEAGRFALYNVPAGESAVIVDGRGRPGLYALSYAVVRAGRGEAEGHLILDLTREVEVPLRRQGPFDVTEIVFLVPQDIHPAFDAYGAEGGFFQAFDRTMRFLGLPDGAYRLESPSTAQEFRIADGEWKEAESSR